MLSKIFILTWTPYPKSDRSSLFTLIRFDLLGRTEWLVSNFSRSFQRPREICFFHSLEQLLVSAHIDTSLYVNCLFKSYWTRVSTQSCRPREFIWFYGFVSVSAEALFIISPCLSYLDFDFNRVYLNKFVPGCYS